MDWGSAIGGAMSAAGSLGDLLTGGYFSRKAWQRQKEAMQNAHQWEVADLRAAGLNPILSATGGSGASTGGLNGSMVGDTSQFSRAVSNAFQGMQMSNILDQQKASIFNTKTQSVKNQAEATTQVALAHMYQNQAELARINASRGLYELEYLKKHPEVFDSIQKGMVGNSAAGLMSLIENIPKDILNRIGGSK